MGDLMSSFVFAAKMLNHAPGMIVAQEGTFGEMMLSRSPSPIASNRSRLCTHCCTAAKLEPSTARMRRNAEPTRRVNARARWVMRPKACAPELGWRGVGLCRRQRADWAGRLP